MNALVEHIWRASTRPRFANYWEALSFLVKKTGEASTKTELRNFTKPLIGNFWYL